MPTASDLCDPICDALYETKAPRLPAICEKLGLAPGDGDEAFRSKWAYVRRRLDALDEAALRAVAAQVEREHPNYALSEVLAKLDEAGQPEIGDVARRRVAKLFRTYSLAGEIDDKEFTDGVWPLATMVPAGACDMPDFATALLWGTSKSFAVHNNRTLNRTWSDEKLLLELGIVTCSRRQFIRVVEAAVHPRTRGEGERAQIVEHINELILPDGWALKPTGRTSGLPVYTVQQTTPAGEHPADAGIAAVLVSFNQDGVHAAWEEALALRSDKPEAAITAARTLIETVCKHILAHGPAGNYDEKDDLPKLYRATARSLNLAPDQHSAEAFKTVLGGCFSVVEGLGTLRNKLGNAHGKSPEQARPQVRPKPRHAELAVNLAGAMAMFLVSTWMDRQAVEVATVPLGDGASEP